MSTIVLAKGVGTPLDLDILNQLLLPQKGIPLDLDALATPSDYLNRIALQQVVPGADYAAYTPTGTIAVTDLYQTLLANGTLTAPLNQQMVACLKAKIAGTPICTIVPEGDSITQGAGADPVSPADGWRLLVNQAIVAARSASVLVEWTGGYTVDGNTAPTQWNNGVGGRSLVQMDAGLSTEYGTGFRVPSITTVIGGTNNARNGDSVGVFTSQYNSLMNNMHTLAPSGIFVVSYVPENPFDSARNAIVSSYNAALPGIWSSLTSSGLTLFQISAPYGLTTSDMTPTDQIHPNYTTGYPKMAAS